MTVDISYDDYIGSIEKQLGSERKEVARLRRRVSQLERQLITERQDNANLRQKLAWVGKLERPFIPSDESYGGPNDVGELPPNPEMVYMMPVRFNPLMKVLAVLYNAYHGDDPDRVSDAVRELIEVYDDILD